MATTIRPNPEVRFTYAEYSLLPDDGRRHELMDGDFYVTPAPAPWHQTVSRRLQFELYQQLELKGVALVFNAPIDVILADTTVVQPDLAVVRTPRKSLVSGRGIEGPPDLVVEILSPSNRAHDEVLKKSIYARFGIPEYWVVDPDHGWIWVHRLEQGAYRLIDRFDRASTLRTDQFPEVSVALEPVFAPL
jgi:Uma2 family endonuclease